MENTAVKFPRILLSLSVSVFLAGLAGCGGSVSTGGGGGGGGCTPSVSSATPASCPSRTPVAGVAFLGKVTAATKPVSGASVQLYAAGNSGNGSAPTPLLAIALTTAADGTFHTASGFTCPSAQTPVYLLSKGGQPASAASPISALWLMTPLGPCGSLNSGSSFVVNEVTTAASVWSLASFMSSGGNVGASCANTTGLDNAFSTADELANPATGASPGAGIPSTLAVPTGKLNTLANALASCTGSAGGSACAPLLNAAAFGSTVPANTLDAALNIARAPGSNVAAIYAFAAANPVFAPALSAAPPDWMLENTISGGGMNLSTSVSVAASGGVWVSSYFNAVSEFSPSGAAIFPAGIGGYGINQSYGMALDIEDNVWIANEQTTSNSGSGNVAELSSSGQAIATGLTGGGINFPIAVAADTNGNMWFADYGDSKVTLLSKFRLGDFERRRLGRHIARVPRRRGRRLQPQRLGRQPGRPRPHHKNLRRWRRRWPNFNCDCDGASGVATDQSGNVWIAELLRRQHQRSEYLRNAGA